MALKAVPKPLNQDLAERRMDIDPGANNWLPENALYSAWEELSEFPATKALVVAWYVPGSTPGSLKLRMRLYTECVNDGTAISADLFQRLTKVSE
jgi:hypothetical protein